MTDINIPPQSVEAAVRAVMLALIYEVEPDARANDLTPEEHSAIATAAIRAALEAWPGLNHDSQAWRGYGGEVLILPLNTEPRDE